MGVNYIAGLRRTADLDPDITLQSVSPFPKDRPVAIQPDPKTDGKDPAAPGGPAPMNAGPGFDQLVNQVATDPLREVPVNPGSPIPHVTGPDLDQTTLHSA